MNLIHDVMYKVRQDHPFHPNRMGRFQFLGGPRSDSIVLADVDDSRSLFAVGLHDLTDFNPNVENIVQKDHIPVIKKFDHNEEIFEVRRREDIRDVSVLWVFYPNCPNSNKIMVFKGNAPTRDAKKVDPHFGREDSPVARFVATEEGWNWAIDFAKSVLNGIIYESSPRS